MNFLQIICGFFALATLGLPSAPLVVTHHWPLTNLVNMSEVGESSSTPELVNRSEEDPELDMEVEENFELCGNYGGARIRLLSQRSVKEELLDGDCSEYEEITVEVDEDFFLKEEDVKEEESFETEEITYQVTNLSFATPPSIFLYLLLALLYYRCQLISS